MSYSTRIALLLVLVTTATAEAQIGPGGGLPSGGPQQQEEEKKKEGVAEAAPKTPGLLPTTPALPPPKGRRKRWKLLELDGYYRLRTDWFKNFNLGHTDDPALGGAPFPRALSCGAGTMAAAGCDGALSSANMRLRLEPTINLDERTSIHVQADVLDNLVLGSTPTDQDLSYDASNPPIGAFNGTQGPPVAGVNSDRDSITIKRAWAEVAVPLGILQFGRQPNQWGMGMVYNSGGADPIGGTYDTDGDYGDSVDRVSFSGLIPGTNLRAMIASDWNVTRLVSNQTSANKGREGHPWDLDDKDDMNSWGVIVSRMDSAQEFRDRVERDELAFNYGVYFDYKTQSFDDNVAGFTADPSTSFLPRNLKTYSPDVWVKLGYGPFTIEAEGIAQLGKVTHSVFDSGTLNTTDADIRKYGGVGRFTFRGLEGKLRLGLESGAASGDDEDNTPQGRTNLAYANTFGDPAGPPDTKLSRMIFNREYKVDMILFRHLIGAVSNAGYVKPFLSYDLTKSIAFKVANITSFALKPVSTPGNSTMYGTEFNADIGYTAGGFYGGVSYGVLFPFGALAHPADTATEKFGYQDAAGNSNAGDASTAHTIQFKLILSF